MNENQNQKIKVASFSILTLCFCSLMVFLSQQNQTPDIQTKALKRAQIYAQRMIENRFIVKTGTPYQGRGLASASFEQEALEGPIGLDPWGHPFQFLVKKNPDNQKKGIVILWSAGPNNKLETTRDMIAETPKVFQGDDFGKSYSFAF